MCYKVVRYSCKSQWSFSNWASSLKHRPWRKKCRIDSIFLWLVVPVLFLLWYFLLPLVDMTYPYMLPYDATNLYFLLMGSLLGPLWLLWCLLCCMNYGHHHHHHLQIRHSSWFVDPDTLSEERHVFLLIFNSWTFVSSCSSTILEKHPTHATGKEYASQSPQRWQISLCIFDDQ